MNKQWWRAALVRAVKTVAQTAVASIGASTILSDIDIKVVVSASILAGILSMLTSIAGIPEAAPVYLEDITAEELTNGYGDEDELEDEDDEQ